MSDETSPPDSLSWRTMISWLLGPDSTVLGADIPNTKEDHVEQARMGRRRKILPEGTARIVRPLDKIKPSGE